MPTTRRDDPAELLRLALDGLDAQIAELQKTRAQLAAMIAGPPAGPAAAAAPQKRKLSAAARKKISEAAKARWEREREAKVKAQKGVCLANGQFSTLSRAQNYPSLYRKTFV